MADVDGILGFDADADQLAAATTAIAELVRRLNHATMPRRTDLAPQDVDRIIAGLHTAVSRLPQLLDQLADRLDAHSLQPRIAATGGFGPEVAMMAAGSLRLAAQNGAELLATHLDDARQQTARLYLED